MSNVLYMHNNGILNNVVTDLRSLRQGVIIIFKEADYSPQTLILQSLYLCNLIGYILYYNLLV